MASEQYLTELFDGSQPIVPSKLQELAGLSDADAIAFRQHYLAAPERRRSQVLEQLVAVAEDNAEFDFDAIFRIGLDDEAAEVRVQGAVNGGAARPADLEMFFHLGVALAASPHDGLSFGLYPFVA